MSSKDYQSLRELLVEEHFKVVKGDEDWWCPNIIGTCDEFIISSDCPNDGFLTVDIKIGEQWFSKYMDGQDIGVYTNGAKKRWDHKQETVRQVVNYLIEKWHVDRTIHQR
jgi:hypothetical protein